MSDTKISALPAASAALGADELPISEAGTSKKLTIAQIQTLILATSSGTAFPTGAALTAYGDDRDFKRTDLGESYYHHGATGWLSCATSVIYFDTGEAATWRTADTTARGVPPSGGQDIYALYATIYLYAVATQNGSNYWTWRLVANGGDVTGADIWNTASAATNTELNRSSPVNAVITWANAKLDMNITKVGAPGNIVTNCSLTYRKIAT